MNQESPKNEILKGGKIRENWKSLISWNNKLDIGNCDMTIMTEEQRIDEHSEKTHTSHSIVVSYKMIGINTYNVFIFDLEASTNLIKYWYEGYQLWESPIKGFLLQNNDFMMLSKDGINIIALG